MGLTNSNHLLTGPSPLAATMQIVPPLAGSQGFLPVDPPPSYVDNAAGVTQGLGTGSVRPLFRARR